MNWINLHTDILRSPAYIGAEPVERATWLNLIAWCCTQENGGVIAGASAWGDRKWQQLCGITKAEAHLASELYGFAETGDLIVNLYPAEKEAEVKVNRRIGAKGGSRKTPAKTEAARQNGANGGRPRKPSDPSPEENPSGNPSETQAETQRKEKDKRRIREGKGKESESGPPHTHTQAPPDGESPSALVPFRPAPSKADVIASLNTCHPTWTSPELDGKEIEPFAKALPYLRSIPTEDWPAIGKFIASRKSHSTDKWRPKNRLQLIDNISEVHGYALDWQRKQLHHLPPKPKPIPEPEGDDATPEDIAALFPRKAAH